MIIERFSTKKHKGCPVCNGIDSKSCVRCRGQSLMCDWFKTDFGYAHLCELDIKEFKYVEEKYYNT